MATRDKELTELRLPRSITEAAALAAAFFIVVAALQLSLPLMNRSGIEPEVRSYVCAAALACIPILFALLKRLIPKLRNRRRERGQSWPWFVTGPIAAALLFAWNLVASVAGLGAGDMASLITASLNAIAALTTGFLIDRRTESRVWLALLVSCVATIGLNLLIYQVVGDASPAASSGNSAISVTGFWLGAMLRSLYVLALEVVGVVASRLSMRMRRSRQATARK